MKRDIHNNLRRYERYKENIQNGLYITVRQDVWRKARAQGLKIAEVKPDKLGKENQEVLLKFINNLETQMKPRPASPVRILHYLRFLSDICRWLDEKGKTLVTATNEDLKQMLKEHVNTNPKYSEWTRSDYRVTLSKFYKVFTGVDCKETPEQVKGIPTCIDKNKLKSITANDILLPEDVQKMVEVAESGMMKCVVTFLFESGMRVGAALSLDYSSVQIKNGEAIVIVPHETKTGQRTVYLYLSVPLLTQWMNEHPTKNPEDPLFISERSIKSGKIQPLTYPNLRKQLKMIGRRAGINKRIYPHLFRHSIASYHMASGLPHKLMCRQFGWSENSNMPNYYSKISDTQLKAGLRQSLGLPLTEAEQPINALKNKNCPACGGIYYGGQSYCRCGQKLDVASLSDKKTEMKDLLKELLLEASPEQRKELISVLNKEEQALKTSISF